MTSVISSLNHIDKFESIRDSGRRLSDTGKKTSSHGGRQPSTGRNSVFGSNI
jgi:hypothetical protein